MKPNYEYKLNDSWQPIHVDITTGQVTLFDTGMTLEYYRLSDLENHYEVRPIRTWSETFERYVPITEEESLADLGEGCIPVSGFTWSGEVGVGKKSTGGPSTYYDMPFDEWVTTNDMAEYLAEKQWGRFGIHLKEVLKAACRWGIKVGTTEEYDSKKIIYYGARLLRMTAGTTVLRTYLQELLDHPQFKDK